MLPLGTMAKQIALRPERLKAPGVAEILSVSSCVSPDFADWIEDWKHNGFWFFDTPALIRQIATARLISLETCRWFYYEGYDKAFDERSATWIPYDSEESYSRNVQPPAKSVFRGYDVVTYSCGNKAECSPLSCNHMAEEIPTNPYCLLDSLETALSLTAQGRFNDCEPGPYRVIAVYEVFFD